MECTVNLAVIPVAGLGTRLLPATKSQPKEMLPVGRKPVIQHVVEEVASAGIQKVLFVTSAGKTSLENHFEHNAELIAHLRRAGKEEYLEDVMLKKFHVAYAAVRQGRQLGLGHAVQCARPFVEDRPFLVALGDTIFPGNAGAGVISRLVGEFARSQADAVIAFEEVAESEVASFGIAKPRGAVKDVFLLEDLVEKPAPAVAPSRLAVAARYVFNHKIFDCLSVTTSGKDGEIQLTDAIRDLMRNGGKVMGVRLAANETRYDVGGFASYYRAFCDFALADPEFGPQLAEHLRHKLSE